MTQTLTPEIINAAIEGFEAQKQRIDDQINELRAMLDGGGEQSTTPAAGQNPKRKFSPDALRRMREAQQRRWAKVRGESEATVSPTTPAKKKRKLSAAGRKAIQDAVRRRWAAKRAGSEPVSAKKTSATKRPAPKASAKTTKRAPTKKIGGKKAAPADS